MPQNRTNIDDLYPGAKSYIILTILFFLLSALALALFYFIKTPQSQPTYLSPTLQNVTPTPELEIIIPTETEPASSPALQNVTPTESEDTFPSPTPTPILKSFTDPDSIFSVTYKSNRTVYQDQQSYGHRYTFYRLDSTITVHLGSDWSWYYPDRQFTSAPISGQSTFRYDIAQQSIVDLVYGDNKITIQCVHSAKDELKAECQDFVTSFKLL